ncbi:ATP-binding cassette domain-containing protein [Spirillospora sp. NPDC029432]|uniref:ATP-binding cassette domain-containing protein n=1 Tax=Spirillospora sp. NPDC029432 TaxID=3154599 RepID=UPI003456125E
MHLERVSFRYHHRAPWVLRDVTLSLPAGRVTEVTGRNGAGKSTFLRLLAGLRVPRHGRITGRPANVGYAPERFPTDQPFTVRNYLGHMAAMRKAPRAAIAPWAERLAFDHLMDTRLAELSKGSAQKVGLAQALLSAPDLLILDEPFSGLDAATRDSLPALITEQTARGTTVVVSDHQRCLEAMPALTRVHINGRSATLVSPPAEPETDEPAPAGQAQAAPGSEPIPAGAALAEPAAAGDGWTVLEVVVRADEADQVAGKLRADGYDVRDPA